jgi:hypothetical protein
MKKLGGCSVTPTSAAKYDWSAGIFAKTVTQSELAANAAAKQVNCRNLIAPCTPDIFLAPRFDWLGVLFCGATCLCFNRGNFYRGMWHICHNETQSWRMESGGDTSLLVLIFCPLQTAGKNVADFLTRLDHSWRQRSFRSLDKNRQMCCLLAELVRESELKSQATSVPGTSRPISYKDLRSAFGVKRKWPGGRVRCLGRK